ncbi:MAG: PKD domain-containing protein [Actinobacteria bacterium]|nr:PKD domain-containing protein [Actinomycetota bacterium]
MLSRLVPVVAAVGLLAGSSAPPAAAATADAAAVAPMQAQLRVAERRPFQLHGVLLDASASTGPIAIYSFHYGDGIVEQSYQPLALHGYAKTGTYTAFVVVVASDGRRATSPSVSIHVRDGVPPVVRIDRPRPHQRMHIGPQGLALNGTASDARGVAKVQLAIQLISSPQHFKTGGNCIWYDGKVWLSLSSCNAPNFFTARFRHGRWSFRIPGSARIPTGSYAIRVRAIDRTGNISHYYALVLRTIVPFRLV